MEFLLSLLLWIFGADAAAVQPSAQKVKPGTVLSQTTAQINEENNSIQSKEDGFSLYQNAHIRQHIIIFEDTHFRFNE